MAGKAMTVHVVVAILCLISILALDTSRDHSVGQSIFNNQNIPSNKINYLVKSKTVHAKRKKHPADVDILMDDAQDDTVDDSVDHLIDSHNIPLQNERNGFRGNGLARVNDNVEFAKGNEEIVNQTPDIEPGVYAIDDINAKSSDNQKHSTINMVQRNIYDTGMGGEGNVGNGVSKSRSKRKGRLNRSANHPSQQGIDNVHVNNSEQPERAATRSMNSKEGQSKIIPTNMTVFRETADKQIDDGINETQVNWKHSPRKSIAGELRSDLDDNTCVLTVNESSVNRFRHFVYYGQFSYVYLNLITPPNVNIQGSKRIVGETQWVWTFYGNDGALEFLNWPVEFAIWSLGLLQSYVFGPQDIELNYVTGDCSRIVVGEQESDLVISKALVNLTTALTDMDSVSAEKYGPSFYCHKERMFIQPHAMYVLCKNIVCPIQALKYSCCNYYYDKEEGGRKASCSVRGHELVFEYEVTSWVVPTIIGSFFLAFSPLLLIYISWRCTHCAGTYSHRHDNKPRNHVQKAIKNSIIFMNGTRHITCLNTIFGGAFKIVMRHSLIMSKVVRFTIPFLSLSVIAFQIAVDSYYLKGFVIECTKKGVPMGFRSMLAGYHLSSLNFLPLLGGPFVACAVYLPIMCAALTIPTSLADVLVSGLRDSETTRTCTWVTRQLTIRHVEMFGSVPIRRRSGYHKVYSVLLGHFYMIINIKFWKCIYVLQCDRWQNLNRCRFWLVLYIPVCVLEIMFCFVEYSLPILSFGILIIRSYCGFLHGRHNRSLVINIFVKFLSFFLIVAVCFCLFMFCTIFLDAGLLTARMLLFTYTGVVVYPKESYGYIIFFFTLMYYLWDCFKEFGDNYDRLLKLTINACEVIHTQQDGISITVTEAGCKGIPRVLFEHVIESHLPRRKQMLISSLKVISIFGILWVSLGLLTQGDRFRELHVIMHVMTALFICAIPKVIKSMCKSSDGNIQKKQFRNEIIITIMDHLGYFEDSETNSDYEYD